LEVHNDEAKPARIIFQYGCRKLHPSVFTFGNGKTDPYPQQTALLNTPLWKQRIGKFLESSEKRLFNIKELCQYIYNARTTSISARFPQFVQTIYSPIFAIHF